MVYLYSLCAIGNSVDIFLRERNIMINFVLLVIVALLLLILGGVWIATMLMKGKLELSDIIVICIFVIMAILFVILCQVL